MKKGSRLFVVASVSILFLLFFAIAYGKVFKSQIESRKNEQTRSQSTVQISWEERYPFPPADSAAVPLNREPEASSAASKVFALFGKLKSLSTDNWVSIIENYNDLARLGYIIDSRLADPSVGAYLKLKNGYWVARNSKIPFPDMQAAIAPYAALQKHLDQSGIPFLYIVTPLKECAFDNELPDGVVSYANENIDTCLDALASFHLDSVDLRKNLHADGLNHYAMFYVTDHHWTVEAGLWAASEIAQELSARYGLSMPDPYDAGDYEPVRYEHAEFGSLGNGVTKYVAQSEDFVVLWPAFETDYRLEVPNKGVDVTGPFEEIFVDRENLRKIAEQKGYTDSGTAYGQILYGNPPFLKITNLKFPEGPRVLMIRDSFANVVAPYLASACSELLLLDTRPNNGNFTGSILSCADEFSPDIVLVLQSSPQSIKLNK